MKRILALLLALVMLFCLTACGGDKESTPAGENTGATTSTNDTTEGTQDNTQGTTEGTLENTVGGNQNNTQGSTGNSTGGNQNNTQEASGNNQSNLQGSTNNTASSENTTTGNNSPTTLPSAQASHSYTEIGNVIPVGGAYVFRKNYESIYEGAIPTSPSVGDYFYYGDYRYEFVCINNKYGWDVYAESLTDGTQYKSSYGKILLSINNFPIIAMSSTFHSNPKLKTAPAIPNTVIDMTQTFHSCTALVSAPKLPEGLRTMGVTFAECSALKTYDGAEKGTPEGDFSQYYIPSKVSDSDIIDAFYACPRVQVLPRRVSNSEPTPSTPSPSTPQPVRVSGVQISKTTLSLKVGDTQQLTATVSPSNADNRNVTWSSSNSSVAQVSSTGKITAKGEGAAVITVTTKDGGYTASCNVTVSVVHVNGVSLNQTALNMTVGKSQQLVATVSPSNADNKNVTWSSSNSSVAQVSSTGKVTAKGKGSATIMVTTADGNYSATCTITVTEPPLSIRASISITWTTNSLGSVRGVVAEAIASGGSGNYVEYYIKVYHNGTLVGEGAKNKIMVTLANGTYTAEVYVKDSSGKEATATESMKCSGY